MTNEAQRLANIAEALYGPINQSFSQKSRPIPLILRSNTTHTNGLTQVTPTRKVTFFTFPPQDYNFIYHTDWINLLAIHELRHVIQQQMMMDNGFISFVIPDWAWFGEGDAVTTETLLSTAGRGRIPYFEAIYKINILTHGGFSYFNQMYGSYHHFLPDHYRLGYFMINYLQRHYGVQIIDQLFQRNNLFEKINPWSLYLKCKQLTGKSIGKLYQDLNHELKQLWLQQLAGLPITSFQLLHSKPSTYTNHAYPQAYKNGAIVLKYGPGDIYQFVSIDASGKEHTLFTPGPIEETIRFSLAKDRLAWIERREPLHASKKRSIAIQTYHLPTKSYKTLVYPSRYSTVALSPDGTQLVAIETDEAYQHHMVILDAQTGKRVATMPNPENNYYLTPTWSPDGRIVAIKHANNLASIVLIDPKTKISQELLPPTKALIGCPLMTDHYLYYNSACSGIDNIYALHLTTKQVFQVTSSQYGAYNPAVSVDGKWLLYNDLGKEGMHAVKTPLNPTTWIPIEKVEDRTLHYYQPVADKQSSSAVQADNTKTYPIQPYTAWDNIKSTSFNFTDLPTSPGCLFAQGIMFQDLLEKYTLILPGLEYEWNSFYKHTGHLFSQFTYHGDYAKADIQAKISPTCNLEKEDTRWFIKQNYQASLHIPLKFHFRHYLITTSFSTAAILNHNTTFSNRWGRLQTYTATYDSYAPKSSRDLYSPWRQSLSVSFMHTPYGGPQTHRLINRLKLHFPGPYKHHVLRVNVLTQHFHATHPLVPAQHRGLTARENALAHHHIRLNYDFPITYPDVSITPFLFLKRLSASLFYSYAFHHIEEPKYHVLGADLVLETQIFRAKFRLMYHLDAGAGFDLKLK
eukprot:gene20-29_t